MKAKIAVGSVLLLLVGVLGLVRMKATFPQGDFDYVALGSSFAAGPGVGDRAAGSYWPCWRSGANYPHLFAQRAGLRLKDVSCSGATSSEVLDKGRLLQPPQIEAVGPETKLVTITIGGNDILYLGNVTASACRNQPQAVPAFLRWLGTCRLASHAEIELRFQELPANLTRIATEVHRRAPQARIVFVDYVSILPEAGSCSRLDLSSSEAETYRELADRLAAVTRQVAAATGAELLQASTLTAGHDLCSSAPWVNGLEFPKPFGSFGPVPFHPKYEAMDAIAQALLEQWQRGSKLPLQKPR